MSLVSQPAPPGSEKSTSSIRKRRSTRLAYDFRNPHRPPGTGKTRLPLSDKHHALRQQDRVEENSNQKGSEWGHDVLINSAD